MNIIRGLLLCGVIGLVGVGFVHLFNDQPTDWTTCRHVLPRGNLSWNYQIHKHKTWLSLGPNDLRSE